MLQSLAIAWPAAPGVEPLSRAFWIHQGVSLAASLLFVVWVTRLAGRHKPVSNVIQFPRRR
jgi:hypothetical protein